MQIESQRIILTGAASGIGRALLEQLAAYPAQILAVDRQQIGPENLPHQAKAQITPYVCDLGQPQAVDALFQAAIETLGGIDLFIANAGFAYYERLGDPDWEHIERIYRVNVFSPLYAAQKMRQLNAGRPYKVVITASAMGRLALPGYALYSSTKAALHRFAEAYAYELDDPHSLVLVYPIATRTGFFGAAAAETAPQPWPAQTSQQVAAAILRGIQREAPAIYPSRLFQVFIALCGPLPFLRRLEQAIEARRFRRWLSGR